MKIEPSELKNFVENFPTLVSRKESKRYPGLSVLRYTKKVFFDALWNAHPLTTECRGLVVDADYNVVVRPFTKIYNYKENGAGSTWNDTDMVLVTKKVNGFMAAVTLYNGQVIISTTGSLDSDFVGYAEKYLSGITPDMIQENHTYLFEICHPDDPHIIPEKEGAHFLAIVDTDGNHLYKFDDHVLGMVDSAMWYFETIGIICSDDKELGYPVMEFGKVKQIVKECRHEGFVIINVKIGNTETLKIKSPWYLGNKAIARKADIMKLNKEFLDEEFYGIVDVIKSMPEWSTMDESSRLNFISEYFLKT